VSWKVAECCKNVAEALRSVAETIAEPLRSLADYRQTVAKCCDDRRRIVAECCKIIAKSLQGVAEIVATCCRVLQKPLQNGCRVSRKLMEALQTFAKGIAVALQRNAKSLQLQRLCCEALQGDAKVDAEALQVVRKSLQKCHKNYCKPLQNVAQSAKRFVEAFQCIQRQSPTEGLPVPFKLSSRERDIWTLLQHTPNCITPARLLTFKRTGTQSTCGALSRSLDSPSSLCYQRGIKQKHQPTSQKQLLPK
jgi:hypothetical protein